MQINRLGGVVYSEEGSALTQKPKVECIFEADTTIEVGAPVQLDLTSNTGGTLVVPTVDTEYHQFCGVYEGQGGTGGATTDSSLTGNQAVDGDVVYVTTYGNVTALVGGTGTAIASGSVLAPSVTAGVLSVVFSTAVAAGHIAPVFALGVTATTAASAPCKIFVRAT